MEIGTTQTDIAAAIEAGKTIGLAGHTEVAGVPVLITPPGFNVQIYEKLMPAPPRTEQTVVLDTATSFIDYFNKFATDNSAIFCNVKGETFTGIIDYHSESKAAWGKHIVKYACIRTEETSAWLKNSGQKMGQQDFAFFIEDNLDEIVEPNGATMLEVVTHLKAKTKINFVSGTLLNNGQTSLQYMEEIEGTAGVKGELKIPETIKLGMRIFHGGDAYQLEARFRYRINNGQLAMWYDIVRPQKTLRAAVDDVYQVIKNGCKCQLFVQGEAK